MGNPEKKENSAGDIYLFGYNAFQTIGWTYIFIKVILYALANGTYYGMWDEISTAIKIFQTLGYIEVAHCILKLVRSSPIITFLQITSRVMVVWGIVTSVPEVANTIGIPLLLVAWCMAEIIRYSYYATTILNCCPYILVWCRYTFFFVLYPLGVTGELLSMYNSLPYIKQRNLYSILMPNKANFSFHYYYIVIASMLVYIPGFPHLYLYMISQRSKVLKGAKKH
ncbi:very-long-chain (3R)-3-hydroxyacyl-CoA dehydratase hpo-8 [Centruroides vittatus]|uniref:very-long-chain (3R)-3-hydroxyacyl-CoA dehydratase hpo-8 n=1 Tax=Centruroides vittatus TaxID=120091 RepID=UPI00350F4D5F